MSIAIKPDDGVAHACVIGWPISHSRSPLIHGYWLNRFGISGRYDKRAVEPEDLPHFISTIGQGGLRGCNVTVPHKVAVLELVDVVSEAARAIGAANTIWWQDGSLHATNTDASGFMDHLCASVPTWSGDDGAAVVVGAGGAARAIIYGLLQAGVPEIRVVNRTLEKAEALSEVFGPRIVPCPFGTVGEVLSDAALLVNTSSLGMVGHPPLKLDLSSLSSRCVVADIVYAPLETELLRTARAQGCSVVDGLGMLLHQAAPGFSLWFGETPTVTDELRALIVADLEAS